MKCLNAGMWVLVVGAGWSLAGEARAGVPECGDIRIEADASCQVKLGASCELGCSAGIYEKACATRGFQVCLPECSFDGSIECTDDCSVECTDQCAQGIDIVCHDNCFPECVDECALACEGAEDTIQCRASCEATCDGECDHQCAQLPPDSSCYDHCMECCHGSCSASANMQCQTNCQAITWQQCEYELEVECSASCRAQGALVCDGQYIIGGDQLWTCVAALTELGLDVVEQQLGEEAREELEEDIEEVEQFGEELGDVMSCTCDAGGRGSAPALGTGLLLLGLLGLRRRRWR